MSSFIQQLYSIVQYLDNIFQLHDSIILCFSVMLDIDLELTDSNGIVNIQNIYKMCVLYILL